MKKLFVITAVSLAALTGAASAMTVDNHANAAAINFYAPNVDVSSLSDATIHTLIGVVHSGDTESEKRRLIQALAK